MLGRRNALALGMGKVELLEDEDGQVLEKLAPDIQVMEVRNWRMGSEAYEKKMVHHEGIKKLWEAKWKFPVSTSPLQLHLRSFPKHISYKEDLLKYVESAPSTYIPSTTENSRTSSGFSRI